MVHSLRFAVLLILFSGVAFSLSAQQRAQLIAALGDLPARRKVNVDTLERVKLAAGWRFRLRYLAEDSSRLLHTPKDYIYAYLFVPTNAGQPLPGIVAIHQDGSHNYIGYREVAEETGDADQHYGLELFRRGYIVICPDRFLHAERRRIAKPDTLADVFETADLAEQHWVGQLLLQGRNFVGKEVYDLLLSTDVLMQTPGLDRRRVGAIGHSAGGYVLTYFMFVDQRIRAGVSSCGVFELTEWYTEDAIRKRNAMSVIPGLLKVGRTADYLGLIAPRPFLMTRGLHEWGDGSPKERTDSKRHVEGTARLDSIARRYYRAAGATGHLKTIYFDEGGGNHAFPPKVKEEVYNWLDTQLGNKH